jgi:hypothetical protein
MRLAGASRERTPAERLDAYLTRGLEVFLGADNLLHARGPQWLRSAARPSLRQHRDELIAFLAALATTGGRATDSSAITDAAATQAGLGASPPDDDGAYLRDERAGLAEP